MPPHAHLTGLEASHVKAFGTCTLQWALLDGKDKFPFAEQDKQTIGMIKTMGMAGWVTMIPVLSLPLLNFFRVRRGAHPIPFGYGPVPQILRYAMYTALYIASARPIAECPKYLVANSIDKPTPLGAAVRYCFTSSGHTELARKLGVDLSAFDDSVFTLPPPSQKVTNILAKTAADHTRTGTPVGAGAFVRPPAPGAGTPALGTPAPPAAGVPSTPTHTPSDATGNGSAPFGTLGGHGSGGPTFGSAPASFGGGGGAQPSSYGTAGGDGAPSPAPPTSESVQFGGSSPSTTQLPTAAQTLSRSQMSRAASGYPPQDAQFGTVRGGV